MTKYKEYDTYEDLTDGEVLDIVFDKFGIHYDPENVSHKKMSDEKWSNKITKDLISKIDMANKYKKALANMLFYQAVNMNRNELRNVLFFEEKTTDNWSIEKCRIQYVKDQLEFIDGGNLDDEINETWRIVNVEIS